MNGPHAFEKRLAEQLAEAAQHRRSGVIHASQDRLKRLFCLERGRLVHAVSNVVEEQLETALVRERLIDEGTLGSIAQQCANQGKKVTRYLVDHQAVSHEALDRVLRCHVRDLLFATLGWSHGESRLDVGTPKLDGEILTDLQPAALLLEFAKDMQLSVAALRARIGPPGICPVPQTARHSILESFDPDPLARYLIARADGTRKLADLLSDSPAETEPTLRSLYGLLLLGLVKPAAGKLQDKRVGDVVTLDEMMARLKRAKDAGPYHVLELSPAASADEIREAYYFLARRYHPDRFRSGPLANLLPEIEQYFSQVTEAYNTLYDQDLRAEYDRKREEAQPAEPEPEQDTAYLAKQNYARAKLLIGRGRYADSVTFLENAVDLDGSQALYFLELGRVLTRNPRRRDEALAHLREALRLEPTDAAAYLALGQLQRKLGQDAEAVKMFQEVLRWEPGHLEASRELQELGAPADSQRRGLFRG